jgi:predicted nucleic acid-binding protein
LREGNKIAVSSISLAAEMVYLEEKARIPKGAVADLLDALSDPGHPLHEIPFGRAVAKAMQRIAREEIPDMPDRIIAATPLCYGLPVISRDRKIRASAIVSIW